MRRRKFPDYGEFAGFGLKPIDAPALAALERLLHERDAAPDQSRKQAAEEALREVLQSEHGVNEFTTTDGKRVEFRLIVHPHDGVPGERLNAFLTANGQRAYGDAGRWAWRLLTEGRALPDGFYDYFNATWRIQVQRG